jgi:hypothetical protein
MRGYALRDGLSFCRTDNMLIFLDRSHDRYFALAPEAACAFNLWLDGTTLPSSQMQLLLDARLLTATTQDEAIAHPCSQATAAAQAPIVDQQPVGITAMMEALARRRVWSWRVRHRPLDSNLLALAERRQRSAHCRPAPGAAGQIVSAYARAARWLSVQDQCLPTALSMALWLIEKGLPAKLLLGVKLHPFQAHSWVELDGMMLGEDPDHVRAFTPIWVG